MPDYVLIFLDDDKKPLRRSVIAAAEDRAALAVARIAFTHRRDGVDFTLWRGRHCVHPPRPPLP